jgi:hypothetical protein
LVDIDRHPQLAEWRLRQRAKKNSMMLHDERAMSRWLCFKNVIFDVWRGPDGVFVRDVDRRQAKPVRRHFTEGDVE